MYFATENIMTNQTKPKTAEQLAGEMVKELAELEHEQWVSWSKSIAKTENLSALRVERWRKLWKPYSQLSEEEKEQDRKWARKVQPLLLRMAKEAVEAVRGEEKEIDNFKFIGSVGDKIEVQRDMGYNQALKDYDKRREELGVKMDNENN